MGWEDPRQLCWDRGQHQDTAAMQDTGAVLPLLPNPTLAAAPSTGLQRSCIHPLQPLSPPYSMPALFLDPTSAPLLRDPFPSSEIRSGHSLQLHSLPAPAGLCSSTAAKTRSCSSNLQGGGRGRGGGRGSGQAKAGVSWCRDPAFARGEIRQPRGVVTPGKAQCAAWESPGEGRG